MFTCLIYVTAITLKVKENLHTATIILSYILLKKMFSFFLFFFGLTAPQWIRASSFTRFLDHTKRRTTVDRTPIDE